VSRPHIRHRRIADIDVVVNHGDEVEVLEGAECRHHRVALQTIVLTALLLTWITA